MKRPEGLDRKISVEQGGKKKISVDRAQVIMLVIIMITIIMLTDLLISFSGDLDI